MIEYLKKKSRENSSLITIRHE